MGRIQQLTSLALWFITLQIAHSFTEKVRVPKPLPLEGFNRSLDGRSINIPAPSLLSKRISFADAIAKGTRLLCRLQNPALLNDQSSVTSPDMLDANGWAMYFPEMYSDIFHVLEPYFTAEGVQNYPEDCDIICWQHTESSKNSQGQDVPPTDGRYVNIYNTNIGAIIAYNNFGPAWMARDRVNNILPDIRAWSDVVFVDWKMQADATGDDIQGLKYVIRYEVANPDTIDTVDQAAGYLAHEWPGLTFPMSDERAQAILGTPNGAGIAYLLATHKEQLGHKTIESVNVWWREFHLSTEPEDVFHLSYIAFKIVPVASSSGPSTTE